MPAHIRGGFGNPEKNRIFARREKEAEKLERYGKRIGFIGRFCEITQRKRDANYERIRRRLDGIKELNPEDRILYDIADRGDNSMPATWSTPSTGTDRNTPANNCITLRGRNNSVKVGQSSSRSASVKAQGGNLAGSALTYENQHSVPRINIMDKEQRIADLKFNLSGLKRYKKEDINSCRTTKGQM